MINPKYLPADIKETLNHLTLELCEYRYTSEFKKDIVLKWLEIVAQKNGLYEVCPESSWTRLIKVLKVPVFDTVIYIFL